jgi:hypothetical protein
MLTDRRFPEMYLTMLSMSIPEIESTMLTNRSRNVVDDAEYEHSRNVVDACGYYLRKVQSSSGHFSAAQNLPYKRDGCSRNKSRPFDY